MPPKRTEPAHINPADLKEAYAIQLQVASTNERAFIALKEAHKAKIEAHKAELEVLKEQRAAVEAQLELRKLEMGRVVRKVNGKENVDPLKRSNTSEANGEDKRSNGWIGTIPSGFNGGPSGFNNGGQQQQQGFNNGGQQQGFPNGGFNQGGYQGGYGGGNGGEEQEYGMF